MIKNKTGKPAFQTGRYFKYAIGEIILVVIGILIALQINNWNEERKELFNETKILNTLHAEFQQNRKTLDSTLTVLGNAEKALTFVLTNINPEPKLNLSSQKLDSVLFETITNPYWKRSEYTLRNLENSGKLSGLSNEDLKTKLYEWSLVSTDIEDKDADATIGFNYLLNYYKVNGSLRSLDAFGTLITEGQSTLSYDHLKFFSDITFENAIDDCLVYMRQRVMRYQKASEIINDIITITKPKND
ncbi:hypothetical protein CA834_10430 [Winogradskyella aurantia]|uniref:Uncharacterized protein n=2 Tax=Winogradskyella aurantia TaxID=1915063 RepID=A0A265URY1_9FLAO|nr:hypothetical protein CA834_10430 [Winogradskyella aurantia]